MATLVAKQEYDFAYEQQRCLRLIDNFTSKTLDEEWPQNPIFGKVSGADLSRLQAKHPDITSGNLGFEQSNSVG